MSARHEIIADPKAMTITVGAKVFAEPKLTRRKEWDTSVKDEIVPFPGLPEVAPPPFDWSAPTEKAVEHDAQVQQRNNLEHRLRIKFYTERLGPKFNRRFQAANYWLWVGNRMTQRSADMLRYPGKQWREYDPGLVVLANHALGHVNEAERDGLYHLVPAIVVFGKSPHEIRRAIGPATWRRIAANSRSRNMRIMQAAMINAVERTERFVRLLDCPSGHLAGIGRAFMAMDLGDELIASRLASRKTVGELEVTRHLVHDARRMGVQINPLWGLARLQREHNDAVREVRTRQFSPKPFADVWLFSQGDYTATRLVSRLDIVMEGDTQHHCVGSYADHAAAGKYVILRVEGSERATVGLALTNGGWWAVDQIYGACNAPVSNKCRAFVTKAAEAFREAHDLREAA